MRFPTDRPFFNFKKFAQEHIGMGRGKLFRDALNMITKPFIDNEAVISEALDGTLGVLNTFSAGILTIVQTISDAFSGFYDGHLKPLFDALAEEHEINADKDECHTQDATQNMVFDTCQNKDRYRRNNDECKQYRPKSAPCYIASQSPCDSSGSGNCQQSRECRSFAIARHEKRQHRHNEDAKTETRSALNETRTNAQ